MENQQEVKWASGGTDLVECFQKLFAWWDFFLRADSWLWELHRWMPPTFTWGYKIFPISLQTLQKLISPLTREGGGLLGEISCCRRRSSWHTHWGVNTQICVLVRYSGLKCECGSRWEFDLCQVVSVSRCQVSSWVLLQTPSCPAVLGAFSSPRSHLPLLWQQHETDGNTQWPPYNTV